MGVSIFSASIIFIPLSRSGGSYLPEIVISNSEEGGPHGAAKIRQNSCTPSLSLIYDFNVVDETAGGIIGPSVSVGMHRKQSECSDATVDLSQISDFSFNSSSDLMLVNAQKRNIYSQKLEFRLITAKNRLRIVFELFSYSKFALASIVKMCSFVFFLRKIRSSLNTFSNCQRFRCPKLTRTRHLDVETYPRQ